MTRRLVSIRRSVPHARSSEYDVLWSDVARHAASHRFHAWRFRGTSDPDSYIEFLEFPEGADPRALPEVVAALDRLRTLFPGPAAVEEDWTSVDP
jgi:hypothetical protein